MNEKLRNVLVGLFVLVSLCALGTLMIMFGEAPEWLGKGDWELTITGLSEIRGVNPGTPVYLNGIEIGRVNRLEFKDVNRPGIGVQLVARIRERYSVPSGAVAKLYGAMLGLGSGQIHIFVGHSQTMYPLPKDGAKIRGEVGSALGEILSEDFTDSFQRAVDHIGNLAAAATPVADNLSNLLESRSIDSVDHAGPTSDLQANLSTAIERFDRLVANLNSVLGEQEVQEDVKGIAEDLKVASGEIRNLVDMWKEETTKISQNLNEGIDNTEKNLDRSFAELIQVIENLDDSTKRITNILTSIESGEGTVGKLVQDDRLYESLVLAAQRLSDVLGSVGRITGKIEQDGYITVGQAPSGVLRKNFKVGPQKDEKK